MDEELSSDVDFQIKTPESLSDHDNEIDGVYVTLAELADQIFKEFVDEDGSDRHRNREILGLADF